MTFSRILIANRGEVAVRIIRTAAEMGIETVAIYSQDDAASLHVTLADIAVPLEHPGAIAYLDGAGIIDIAKQHGCEAIHPGWGFLSENSEFARLCGEAGLTFIGPEPAALARLGDKAHARLLAESCSVPILAGINAAVSVEEAREFLRGRGPAGAIIIKAVAGGGGRGMRVVRTKEELGPAIVSAKREAKAAFGDDRMLIEKYVDNPRHIEVQIIGDSHGNLLSLFERECTLQRRHQKVIEEAPSPTLNARQREAVCEAARKAAGAVDYVGAGTIEFVSDGKDVFFIEMNTRLQVEHPVTELITGIDLVEWQLRVAFGEKLPLTQDQIRLNGHAIEARVYAEDPVTMYPSPGTITAYEEPAGDGVRIEGWVTDGTVVTPFYDPLLAKVVVWDETRDRAIQKMRDTLARYRIEGIKTNISLLQKVLDHPGFVAGQYDVTLLSKPL